MIFSQMWLIDNNSGNILRYVEGLWSGAEWIGPVMDGPHNLGSMSPTMLYQSHHYL